MSETAAPFGTQGMRTGRADAQATGSALALLMDELAHGILLATPSGRLLHANQAARQELARGRALAVHEGHLQAEDARQSRQLLQALAKGGTGRRSLLRLVASSGCSLSLVVVPLGTSGRSQEPVLALYLSRAAVCDTLMLCFFARAHALTATEEQVLAILCQGCSAPEVAKQLKVAVSTVRSHIRSICAKTQSSGVRTLVARLAVLPPLGSSLYQPVH